MCPSGTSRHVPTSAEDAEEVPAGTLPAHMPKDAKYAEYAEEVPTGTLSAHTEKMPKDAEYAEYAEYAEEVPTGTLSAHTEEVPKMPKTYPPAYSGTFLHFFNPKTLDIIKLMQIYL